MRNPGRAQTIGVGLLLAILLSGCSSPNLRSAVYQYGKDYALMDPNFGPPKAPERTNKFFYLPGAVTVPFVGAAVDHDKRESMVWYPTRGEDCSPRTSVYTLNDIRPADRLAIDIEYMIDSRNLFIPVERHDRELAKIDLKLNDNDLRWLRRIAIHINDVKEYRVDEARMLDARMDMQKRCLAFLRRFKSLYQIESVLYAGDVKVELDAVQGVSVKLTERLRSRILHAVTNKKEGNGVFFAVMGRPI